MKKSRSIPENMKAFEDKDKFRQMAQRRQSAPSIVIRGVLGRSSKLPASLYKDDACEHLPGANNSQRLSLKFGSHGAMLNLSKRQYIMEGKVQLTTGMQTQDRYMFLFSDLLLIAKAKSGSNYKLKCRARVCELWIASCLDDVCELTKSPEKSFVIGWPTANCVATFSSPESKELWLNALAKKISEEKAKERPKKTTLKVINRDVSSSHVKFITVTHTQTAKDVVQLAIKEFNIEVNDDSFQLWVISRKERTAYPLIGHEIPHSIQMSHIRDTSPGNGMIAESDITASNVENNVPPDICSRCQFILRSNRQAQNKCDLDIALWPMTRTKSKTPAALFNWARKKHITNNSGQRHDSSDSGLASLSGNSGGDASYYCPSPSMSSSPASPKLFSLPLNQVCDDGGVPKPIMTMLDVLYRKGPYTTGIFRKSANAKTTRLLKQKLNEDTETDLSDAPIHVVAALVKDFLRNIPNSVLDSALYNKWTDAIDQPDDEDKIYCIRSLFSSLADANSILVWRLAVVLSRIVSRSKCNNMTSYNLAVCIAPSLLWPPGPGINSEAPRKVTEILQYIIEHVDEIFDGIVPTDDSWPPDVASEDENDEYRDGEKMNCTEAENTSESGRTEDQQDAHEEFGEESDAEPFNRSGIIRRQLPRRHLKTDTALKRMLSLSQDGLERVISENRLSPEVRVLDDMMLTSESDASNQMHTAYPSRRRGGDTCNMSNDSGFTTLSGDDDDVITGNGRDSRKLNSEVHPGDQTTNLNQQDLELQSAIYSDNDFLETYKDSRFFRRRKSQPILSRRHLNKTTVGSPDKSHLPVTSRIVIPVNSSPAKRDEEKSSPDVKNNNFGVFTFSLPSPDEKPRRQQPVAYARLNDIGNNESQEQADKESTNLVKEYLNELRKKTTEETVENIAEITNSRSTVTQNRTADSGLLPVKKPTSAENHATFSSHRQLQVNSPNASSPNEITFTTSIRQGTPQSQYINPIQKLTVHLHSLPDFRQRSNSAQDNPELDQGHIVRTKPSSSSVRYDRKKHRFANGLQSHFVKAKPTPKPTCSRNLFEDRITAPNPNPLKSRSANFESETPHRTRRSRASRMAPSNRSGSMSPTQGRDMFSKSLPTGEWKQMENRLHPRPRGSRSPEFPQEFRTSRKNSSPQQPKEVPSGLSSPTISARVHNSPGDVKSKVSAYNHIIANQTVTPNNLRSHPLRFSKSSSVKKSPKESKMVGSPKAPAKSTKSLPVGSHPIHVKDVVKISVSCLSSPEGSPQSGKRVNISITTSERDDDVLTANPQSKKFLSENSTQSGRPSPQLLSDEVLFSMSESFAFGNRKSPRSLTPCGTPRMGTPRESPVFTRRSRTDPRQSLKQREADDPKPHSSPKSPRDHGDHHYKNSQVFDHKNTNSNEIKQNSSVPPLFSPKTFRKKNSCDSFPFMGLEKVIHSEESYV